MVFKLALLWAFVLLIRPQDFFPLLQSLRPALVLTALVTLGLVFSKERRISDAIRMTDARLYLLFLAVGMIGVPFAYHRGVAFESVVFEYSVNVLFFLVLISEVDSLKRLRAMTFMICCGALGFSALGIAWGGWTSGRFEIPGGMFDPNDVGYILVTLIPFSAFFALGGGRPLMRLAGVAACGASLALVIMTGSRGALLGLVTIGTLMLLTNKTRLTPTAKLGIVALIAIAVVVSADKINMERYISLFELGGDYNLSDERGRMEIWARGMDLLLANPILGVGMNCFAMALGMMREGMGAIPAWQVAHNSFVQVAVETGLFGFGVFCFLNIRCWVAFMKASRLPSENAEATELRLLGGLMVLAFFGHFVTANFLTQGYSMYFTLLFSVGAIMRRLQAGLVGTEDACPRPEVGLGARALNSPPDKIRDRYAAHNAGSAGHPPTGGADRKKESCANGTRG